MTDNPLRIETRRARDFVDELVNRARTWLPQWNLAGDEADPGRALLEVAARLNAEVAERLDQVGEKNRRNFYAWLGIRGAAARGARVPVAFKLTDNAQESVLAAAPVQMQADANGTALVFESESDVRLVPARVEQVVAIDPAADAFYLPPPGLSSLDPLPLAPVEWRVKSFAAVGAIQLQLEPPLGLEAGMILQIEDRQYRIDQPNDDIVRIEPAVDAPAGIAQGTIARKLTAFGPFDGTARNQQNHALYIGHQDLLNIESTATIIVLGAASLSTGVEWQYWGLALNDDDPAWHQLSVAPADPTIRGGLLLNKTAVGAIEPTEIGGAKSRWIRAVVTSLAGSAQPLSFGELQLRTRTAVNPTPPAREGLTNTTPLVLDSVFLPLGREPRQFDAFYLGCEEVFSKRRATVTLGFSIADGSFASLSAIQSGPFAGALLAGVDSSGSLQLLSFNPAAGTLSRRQEPMQPTRASPDGGKRVDLDRRPTYALPIWSSGTDFSVAMAAGNSVWVRYEAPWLGFWIDMGDVAPPVANGKIGGLAYVEDGASQWLYAAYDGKLRRRRLAASGSWEQVDPTLAGVEISLLSVAAIATLPGVNLGVNDTVLLGVSDTGALYEVTLDGRCTLLLPNVEVSVPPIAARFTNSAGVTELVAFGVVLADSATGQPAELVAFSSVDGSRQLALQLGEEPKGIAHPFDPADRAVLVAVGSTADGRLLEWSPFTADPSFELTISQAVGRVGGAPLQLATAFVVPGEAGYLLTLALGAAASARGDAPLQTFAVIPVAQPRMSIGDLVTIGGRADVPDGLYQISGAPTPIGSELYYPIALQIAATPMPQGVIAFPVTSQPAFTTNVTSISEIEIHAADTATQQDSSLLIRINAADPLEVFLVTGVDTSGPLPLAEIVPNLTDPPPVPAPALPATVDYWLGVDTNGRVASILRLDQVVPSSFVLDSATLASSSIMFPGADPWLQRAVVRRQGPLNEALWVELELEWRTPPSASTNGVTFGVSAWTRQLDDASLNPELSWEYSDGRSWWSLPQLSDSTRHLKTTGTVKFEVPDEIVASDWAGRTNYWIRARLIGGDYGKEVFKVTSEVNLGVTTQSVERSTEGIRAPAVVSLSITYELRQAVFPQHVVAEDAGTFRDQSDANRTLGAEVEAFVPLAVTIARLAGNAVGTAMTSELGVADCDCPPDPCKPSTAEATAAGEASDGSASGRALLIGIKGVMRGEPVNLLMTVARESRFDGSAPLQVEALVAGRFQPIVAEDETRALGESGLISMSIARAPTETELFGSTLSWLRLSPSSTQGWQPSVSGVWLNSAWARAAETQTLEVLGSSEGAPHSVFFLARPPVLRDTLELRVREPLGTEEADALRLAAEDHVLSNVPNLPGHWVLWQPVVDPADSAPGNRVYSLDEASGEVRFGDGAHGMIPPIGRDNIIAVSYRRTEHIAAATDNVAVITARSALGLVTPVEGVEAVIAAADAGSGAPPDDIARVLRFAPARLRHRERAVTLRDVEDLVLQTLPGVAQACCLRDGPRVRLIIVMRGRDPQPPLAIVREVEELLRSALPAAFDAGTRLSITGPTVRRFGIHVSLGVPSLEAANRVSELTEDALRRYFDPITGGNDGHGWPLGRAPDEGEIAARLVDIPELDRIEQIAIVEASSTGERAWTRRLRPPELAMLAADGLDFSYALPEPVAA